MATPRTSLRIFYLQYVIRIVRHIVKSSQYRERIVTLLSTYAFHSMVMVFVNPIRTLFQHIVTMHDWFYDINIVKIGEMVDFIVIKCL